MTRPRGRRRSSDVEARIPREDKPKIQWLVPAEIHSFGIVSLLLNLIPVVSIFFTCESSIVRAREIRD